MNGSRDYDLLHAALTGGGDPERPRRYAAAALAEIAEDRRRLPAVRHPLGFLCLPLVRAAGRGVCVHVFDAGPGPAERAEPVHAHSWELRSYVLFGRVANHRMRVRDAADGADGQEPVQRVFEVHSTPDGVDELRPTPRLVRAAPGTQRISAGGQTYTLDAGDFHATATSPRVPTATLVLGRTLPGRRDLSLGPVDGRGHRVVRQSCAAEETRRTVRAALARVAAT